MSSYFGRFTATIGESSNGYFLFFKSGTESSELSDWSRFSPSLITSYNFLSSSDSGSGVSVRSHLVFKNLAPWLNPFF
jgi:hypothetical protein